MLSGIISGLESISFLGITMFEWIIALAVFTLSFIGLRIAEKILLRVLRRKIPEKGKDLKDILERIDNCFTNYFYIFISLFITLDFLALDTKYDTYIRYLALIVIVYYIVRVLLSVVDFGTKKIISKREDGSDSVIRLMGVLVKALLWAIAIITILSNMGVDVTSLVASLGIGGLAVALALQTVFHDLFAAFSIYLDKPFEVGDFIIIGEQMGTVKKIGVRSTRLESLWGQEIVISNQDLTSARVDNYKKMEKRRVHFHFGVTYQTSVAKLKKIKQIVKDIFEKLDDADLDRVHFKAFGDSSLDFEVAYYVKAADFAKYMDCQEAINLELVEKFANEKIEFAYPTRTIFMEK